jgi:transposase
VDLNLSEEQLQKLCKGDPEIYAFIKALLHRIDVLEQENKELKRQVGQNSNTSSKPPSSDGYRKPTNLRQSGGKKGAPNGHKGSTLKFAAVPDHIVDHSPSYCEKCQTSLEGVKEAQCERRQEFDIPAPKVVTTEHRLYHKVCPYCNHLQRAAAPAGVSAPTQYGAGFAAWTVYLSVYQLMPLERIGQLFEDLYGCRPCDKTLLSYLKSASDKLESTENTIRERLKESPVLHCDETGLRIQGETNWMHVASNALYTLLTIHTSRGSKGMKASGILAHYDGIVVHDSYAAYFRDEFLFKRQLCCAHLLRELQGITEYDKHRWSGRMKQLLQLCWKLTCKYREQGKPIPEALLKRLESRYDSILVGGEAEWQKDPVREKTGPRGRKIKSKAGNLGQRLIDHKAAILRFLYDPLVPFDNNQAERDMRMVKVKQKISGCFRTWKGAVNFARIRSVISTFIKQSRPVLASLSSALREELHLG